jgi:hypothetical protein
VTSNYSPHSSELSITASETSAAELSVGRVRTVSNSTVSAHLSLLFETFSLCEFGSLDLRSLCLPKRKNTNRQRSRIKEGTMQ